MPLIDSEKVSTTVLIRLPAERRDITAMRHGWDDVLGEPERRKKQIRADPAWKKLSDKEKLKALNVGGFANLMGLGEDETNTQFYNGTIFRVTDKRDGPEMWVDDQGKMKLSHHLAHDEPIKGHGVSKRAWGPNASKCSDLTHCIYSSWSEAVKALPPLPLDKYGEKVLASIARHNENAKKMTWLSTKEVPGNEEELRQAVDEGPFQRGAIVAFYLESVGEVPQLPLRMLSEKCPSWEIAAFYFCSRDGAVGEFGFHGGSDVAVWLEGAMPPAI